MSIAILVGLFLVFMFLGMPVAFAMGVPAIAYLIMRAGDLPLAFMPHAMTGPLFNFVLIALPVFLLMGRMLNTAGLTDRLFHFAIAIVGRFRGGLAYANVLASMFFSSMSGTAVGDAGGLGFVQMEMMTKAGYRRAYSAGISAASPILGPLFPPSVTMVLIGASAQISIGQLFLGGIIPGFIMTAALLVHVFITSKVTEEGRKWPVTKLPIKETISAIANCIPPLMTPVIVVGGIMTGVFTPTEAAVAAFNFALLLGILYRKVTLKSVIKTLMDTVEASGTFLIITACAGFFTWMITNEGMPQMLASVLSPIASRSQLAAIFLLAAALVAIGCFMDTAAAVIMLTPALMPIIISMGIDPIYFGVVMTVALITGIITPPVGICIFVMSDVAKLPVSDITKEAIKYLPAMFATLIIIILIPEAILWIPRLVFG